MKNVFSLLLLVIATFTLSAQQTYFALGSSHHEKFYVFINGERQNDRPTESIHISDMNFYGHYDIRIEIADRQRNSQTYTDVRLQPGPNDYILEVSPRSGRISWRAIDYPIRAKFVTKLVRKPEPPHPGHPGQPAHPSHPGQPGHPGQPIPPPPAPAAVPAPPMPCSQADFMTIKNMVSKEAFEDDKLALAKQAIPGTNMTASQLADIARVFSFEDTKLEFLKFAYPFCIDQNKYFLVNDVFSFSTSKDELRRYIGQ